MSPERIKFLVIGGDGLIGASLSGFLKKAGEPVISTSRKKSGEYPDRTYLDLRDDIDNWGSRYSAGAVVFCSGITKVDQCEQDKLTSRIVNVESVCSLARIQAGKGARIIFLSSNAVFDGSKEYPSPEEPVSPVTEYGRQKAEVEHRLMDEYPSQVTVLRLTKVLGAQNPLFDNWADLLKRGDTIHPFSDMYIAPIPVSFVVSVIRLAVDRNVNGILHVSGDEDFSYADIAFKAADWIGARKSQVEPIPAWESGINRNTIRTSKTALESGRLKYELGIMPPPSLWTIRHVFTNPVLLNGA